jgi:glycosyltransferase involved in cell wall biosynthesis
MTLSIIIPVFNERDTIGQLLAELIQLCSIASNKKTEVIVVDDGSFDGSDKIIRDFADKYTNISCISLPINHGKGKAVRTAIESAKGDTFLICDADLELTVQDIPLLISAMPVIGQYFVNGSRYLRPSLKPSAFSLRYLANRFISGITSVLTGINITDVTCGYKLFTRALYQHLQLREDGFGFETEFIIKALQTRQFKIVEVPVRYSPRNNYQGRKFRFRDGLRIIWVIFKYGVLGIP